MARRKSNAAPPAADIGRLSADDRAALSKEAAKSVAQELDQAARDAYFATEIARLRAAEIPDEALVEVTMDLPVFGSNVMLDGVQFFHAFTYEVPHKQRLVLFEQMQRAWQHQDEIDGRSRFNSYRRPQNITIGPRSAGTPTVGANGPVVANLD